MVKAQNPGGWRKHEAVDLWIGSLASMKKLIWLAVAKRGSKLLAILRFHHAVPLTPTKQTISVGLQQAHADGACFCLSQNQPFNKS
jgi:alpha-D-ribose 1-methylphosphonate 5-triphosphate synthase subunit PhnH